MLGWLKRVAQIVNTARRVARAVPVVPVIANLVRPIVQAVQPVVNAITSIVGGQQPSGDAAQASAKPPKPAQTGLSAEEGRKRERERQAGQFDRDIAQQQSRKLQADKPDLAVDLSPVDPSYLLLILDNPLARRIHNLDPISHKLLQGMVTAYRGDVGKAVVNFFGDVWPDDVEVISGEIMARIQRQILSSDEETPPEGLTRQEPDRTNVDAYVEYLLEAYGVTIQRDFAQGDLELDLPLEALEQYEEGLGVFSDFLGEVMGLDAESLTPEEKGVLFQQVMGRITIRRTTDRHEDSGETAFGFAQGHTIWDMFTVNGNERQSQMSADLFIHELFHSFNLFAGFGGQRPGSLFARSDIIARVSIDADGNLVPDLLEARDGVVRQNPGILRDEAGNFVGFDTSELLADLGLFYARGLIEDDEIREAYRVAVRQATLYHTPPAGYAATFGTSLPLQSATGTGVTFRVNSPTAGAIDEGIIRLPRENWAVNAPAASFDSTAIPAEYGTIEILAITEELYWDSQGRYQRWVYVAISSGNQGSPYFWIREDALRDNLIGDVNLDILPQLPSGETGLAPFENLDPYRPFDANDMYNPSIFQRGEGG